MNTQYQCCDQAARLGDAWVGQLGHNLYGGYLGIHNIRIVTSDSIFCFALLSASLHFSELKKSVGEGHKLCIN